MNKLISLLLLLPRRLSRITSGGNFVPEVDGLRFLAIFPVVLHHLLGTFVVLTKQNETAGMVDWKIIASKSWWAHLISHGNYGVQIFFVISGFILALPFARKHFGFCAAPSLRTYFLRRVSRLEPTYIINLSIIFLLCIYHQRYLPFAGMPNFLASLFYLHNQIFAEVSRISDVTWSLEVEVQFYLLAPLLSTVFIISDKHIRRSVIIGAIIASSLMCPYNNPRFALSLVSFIHYFLCGFLLADLFLVEWKEKPHKSFQGDIVACAGAALFIFFIFEVTQSQVILPLSILLIFIGAFKGYITNYIFTRKLLVVVGGMCYTIYLYHNLIISFTLPLLIRSLFGIVEGQEMLAGFGLVVIVTLPIILVASSLLFVLFERPFMKKGWYRSRRVEVTGAVNPIEAGVDG